MFKNYLFLLMLLFLFSCEEKNDSKNNKLVKVDSIEIPISSDIKYSYNHKQVVDIGGETKLLVSNLNSNGFLVFNLKKKIIEKRVNYKSVGPNSIESGSSGRKFYYKNKDSIFIFGQQNKKVFLTNDKSEVLDSYDLSEMAYFNVGEPIIGNKIPAFFKKNILTFCVYPFVGSSIKKSANGPVIVHLNIKTRQITEGKLTYKFANQLNKHPALHFPTGTTRNEINTFCFPFDDKIYLINGEKLTTKKFNSDYVQKYKPMTKGLQFMKEFDVTGTFNELILYDKYNDLYYLFLSLGIDKLNKEKEEKNRFTQKPFSVLVFDHDLNKLFEQKFKGGQYLVKNSFVTKQGLYLFKNNPENIDFDENYYKFDIYKFNKK